MSQDHKNVAPWTTKRRLVSHGAMMLRKGISALSRDFNFRKLRKDFRSSADDHLASVHDIDTSDARLMSRSKNNNSFSHRPPTLHHCPCLHALKHLSFAKLRGHVRWYVGSPTKSPTFVCR